MKKLLTLAICTLFCLGAQGNAKQEEYSTVEILRKLETVRPSVEIERPDEQVLDLRKIYRSVTRDENLIEALEMLKGTVGEYSRGAILGNNLTGRPIKIEYKNLGQINPQYSNFDALGWKKGSRLYIYINEKHQDAPAGALSALLAHEAIHQDELNSLNEETYAWTLEAAVWAQQTTKNPDLEKYAHPLVSRESTLKRLFIKGSYTDKYIRKVVVSNPGYQSLPSRSPGFEDPERL